MKKNSYELKKQINFTTIQKSNRIKKTGFNPYNNISSKVIPIKTIDLQNTDINEIKNEIKTVINHDSNEKNTNKIIEENTQEILDNISCEDSV